MSDSIVKLTDANFASKIEKGVMLVDFFADWCGPCRMLSPVLEQVAKELKGKASIGKLDIDAEQNTASQFQVTSIPTLILFKDGKEKDRIVGLRDGETIKKFILAAV
jgi:thioredoxin 1